MPQPDGLSVKYLCHCNWAIFPNFSPYPGILKKSSSSVDYLSRESTPDSGLGRIYDSVSGSQR